MDTKTNNAVDFNDPKAIDEAVAEAYTADATAAAPKKLKEKKPRVIKVTFVADRDIKEGEEVTFDYTIPASNRIRGINNGIPLEEMTPEQLKIEYRNANSVLYKTKKAGRDATAAQARFDKVVARMNELGVAPSARTASAPKEVDAATVANLIKTGKITVEDIEKLLNE